MAILGYDPAEFHTGRAPIEAAAMGVTLGPDDVAYRCNLVTVDDDVMVDFAGGHPSRRAEPPDRRRARRRARRRPRRRAVLRRRRVPPSLRHPPRLGRRGVRAAPRPHRAARSSLPTGPAAPHLRALDGRRRARRHRGGPASGALPTRSGSGARASGPSLPAFAERFGVEGRLSSAVDLVRGLGVLTGLEVVDVPGATAGFDNDYRRPDRGVPRVARGP